ncbi:unnamed protein product [Rotaria sp. Silwood2]|nr:unnamed protein product [Rotaria sp. Silwood2]
MIFDETENTGSPLLIFGVETLLRCEIKLTLSFNIVSPVKRERVSTPNISNGEPVFSVSSTEQASSAESLISSSRTTDHTIDLMQGFRDQIARQYDALVAQTQLEPTIEEPATSLWLSSPTEDFLTPIHSNTSNSNNWLELGEYNEETLLTSKG